MRKILLIVLFLIVSTLLFPHSEAFAQAGNTCPDGSAKKCAGGTDPDLSDGLCPGPNGRVPPICPTNIPGTPGQPAGQVNNAAQAAQNARNQTNQNQVVDPCPQGNTNCTKATGSPCTPGATTVTNSGKGITTAIGCIPSEPKALIEGLLRYGTFAAGGIAFLLMLLAALQMITAEGNPENIKQAQERFYSAIIGLLLIVFSVLLMQVIGVDLLGLRPLQPNTFPTFTPGEPF